ncbi:MAG: alpha-ketoglutarate-dependent dioxygenase AlkB [Paracoccaceae bacterium]|nr:alpha-ketoglutarate-dependent dioxygenase AlkB [Paracoccaceae bacterium]
MAENDGMRSLRPTLRVNGVPVWQELLSPQAQQEAVSAVLEVAETAPFVVPVTPSGRPMSVGMTSAGSVGWITDRGGYRYETRHPSGVLWPPIPEAILAIWRKASGVARPPSSCLINLYREGARMGLHQDKDEGDLTWPVVSVSLGDAALFRVGGTERKGRTESLWLNSGDVAVLSGETRLAYHGIDRIRAGSSSLVPGGGRINLTMRVVAGY